MSKRILQLFFLSALIAGIFACKEEQLNSQAIEDEELIQDYLKRNNLEATRTNSGLYYIFTKRNETGEPAKGKSTAYVHYVGRFLNDSIFAQCTKESYDPEGSNPYYFRFRMNNGEVIRAWDEAVMLMKKGEKIRIIIPSHLGYGTTGRGPVPPNTVVQYEIDLEDLQ